MALASAVAVTSLLLSALAGEDAPRHAFAAPEAQLEQQGTVVAVTPPPVVPVVPVVQSSPAGDVSSPSTSAVVQVEVTATAIVFTDTVATPLPAATLPAGAETTPPADPTPDPTVTPVWQPPQNLSRSGATSAPQVVVDARGRYHALWRDAIDGFVYASGDGTTWSAPVALELPFATRRGFPDLREEEATPRFSPVLAADAFGNIHALWVDPVRDKAGVLFHSRVVADQFAQYDAWSPPTPLETGVAAPAAVAVDDAGRLHLSYVRTREDSGRPAGVYYRRLSATEGWSAPTAVYVSRYLRGIAADDVHVRLLTRAQDQVILTWDDPGREQVFVSRSVDAGRTWEAPLEVDRRAPEDSADSPGPARLVAGAAPGGLVLTWGAGHEPGRECTQYYRTFNDADGQWTLPQPMDDLATCLTAAQFLAADDTLFLLGMVEQEGLERGQPTVTSYLMAWDGARWSLPQVQEPLSSFINPDTNQPTNLGCQQGIARDGRLAAAICDRGTGQDIWWTSRALGDVAEWFPPEPVWQGPERTASSETEPVALQLVADNAGNTHAMWIDGASPEVYHMRWDGQTWSSPQPVLSSANGPVEQLAVASYGGRLFLAGRDAKGLFYSDASADRPSEWAEPRPLDEARPGASSPFILANNAGVTIVYAVALNEDRGVYLTRSVDDGRTWSEPRKVFDGTAAGWDMVDQPQLAKTQGGELHLQMLRRGLPPDARPQALSYSRSTDDGLSWTAAEDLVKTPVVWSRLYGVGERVVHRLWAEETNGRAIVWHAQSIDDGLTWGQANQVADLNEGELPDVTVDTAGRLHVLALNRGRLLNWVWDGQGWQADESLQTALADGGLLGASADAAGRLVSLYAGLLPGMTEADAGRDFFAMWRPLAFPSGELPPPPTLTPTPPPTATPPATAAPSPTPTVVVPQSPGDGGVLGQVPGGRVGQLAFTLLPALLVVGLVLVVGLRALRMRGRP